MPVRFHLDEHISSQIADSLRRRNIDVTTTQEVDLLGAADHDQLAFASAAGRVLVTHDSDFLRLHAAGTVHAGIAYCPQGSMSMGNILRRLILVHDLLSADEIAGRVEFL